MNLYGENGQLKADVLWWLNTPIEEVFTRFTTKTLDSADPKKRRIFIDRESRWLFVAHVDTVQKPRVVSRSKSRKTIHGAGFDDRLGCYLAHTLSAEYSADLLLCDLEERGQSTAQYHDCADYNFIVEFDRAGTDVVTYEQDNKDFRNALSEFWRIGIGMFSDISFLRTDACCMNLGIGYYHAHSADSLIKPKDVRKQVELFRQFFAKYRATKFVADEPLLTKPRQQRFTFSIDGADYSYDYYNHDHDHDYGTESERALCDICNLQNGEKIYAYYICKDCIEAMIYGHLLKR